MFVGSSRVTLALDLLHESLPPVTNIPGKEWVPGPQLKYWGAGGSFTSRSHPSYCLPGQMLLSRGSWGLYLPSNLEDSVLRSPKDGPCPCMFP